MKVSDWFWHLKASDGAGQVYPQDYELAGLVQLFVQGPAGTKQVCGQAAHLRDRWEGVTPETEAGPTHPGPV